MFPKISSSGPFELECLHLLYPSKYLCFPGSMIQIQTKIQIQNKQKQRKQKINRILSQVERERPWKKGKSYIFMSPMALFFPAFWVFIGSCKFHSSPCVETRQSGWGGRWEIMSKCGVRSGLRQWCLVLRWKQYRFIFDRDIYPSKYTYLYIHIYICVYT